MRSVQMQGRNGVISFFFYPKAHQNYRLYGKRTKPISAIPLLPFGPNVYFITQI